LAGFGKKEVKKIHKTEKTISAIKIIKYLPSILIKPPGYFDSNQTYISLFYLLFSCKLVRKYPREVVNKYSFNPYSKIFPQLFVREKERIKDALGAANTIEHVGSTAVPSLGGKGIIDIAIAVNKADLDLVTQQLTRLGYEFRPTFSTKDRYYFIIYLPDPEEGTRRYHVHLTYPESNEWKKLIGFRDYLRTHPEMAHEYAEIKKKAASEANQDGKKYRALKEYFFEKVSARIILIQ